LLPRPVHLKDAAAITPDDLQRVIGLLKATFSHVIVDLSKSYSELDMVALKTAEHVLMMTQLDLPCLRNVVRLLSSFEEIEGLKDKTKIVVNRVGLANGDISLKKAQETINRDIFWQLPNDYRTMVEVRNNGVPLIEQAPKAPITQSVIELSEALAGGAAATTGDAKKSMGGWFNFFAKPAKTKAGKEEA
jgi:pilus assembly protein CpaE